MHVYTGAYTEEQMGHAEGIGLIRFDTASGEIGPVEATTPARNPSYLALSTDRTRLYAVDELEEGAVSAFRRDPATGALERINGQPTGGAHPCHLSLDSTGRFLLVVNYTGGNLAVLPIATDGSLEPASQALAHEGSSIDPCRQGEPHPHMILSSPDGRFVYVTDLGIDQVICYRLDTEFGTLTDVAATDVTPGMGPRHFAFSPDGQTMVVIGELNSTLNSYAVEDDGTLTPASSISTLPAAFTGSSSCAHVLFSPDGRFVYGSNRGHDSIAVASFDADSRALEIVEIVPTGGKEPRNFTLDPSGRWLLAANQSSDTIAVFSRDEATGKLTPTGATTESQTPVCLLFTGEK
jgi:6-phosphogluconolactonase